MYNKEIGIHPYSISKQEPQFDMIKFTRLIQGQFKCEKWETTDADWTIVVLRHCNWILLHPPTVNTAFKYTFIYIYQQPVCRRLKQQFQQQVVSSVMILHILKCLHFISYTIKRSNCLFWLSFHSIFT